MLKNEKSANRNDHQNRKTEVFYNKNRKTDLKNSQNRKKENPTAPILYQVAVAHVYAKKTPVCLVHTTQMSRNALPIPHSRFCLVFATQLIQRPLAPRLQKS